MDIYKMFLIELPAFKAAVDSYTSSENISNYFTQLEEATKVSDLEIVLYTIHLKK